MFIQLLRKKIFNIKLYLTKSKPLLWKERKTFNVRIINLLSRSLCARNLKMCRFEFY